MLTLQGLVGNRAVNAVLRRGGAGVAAPPSVTRALASAGTPLSPAVRQAMESRFGADLGGVRVHTDRRAAESALDVGAPAYAVGEHVAFARGHYAPESGVGRRLLAHELAHVVQARDAPASGPATLGPAHGRLEAEADRASAAPASGGASRLSHGAPGAVVRRGPEQFWRMRGELAETSEKLRPIAEVVDAVTLKHPTAAATAYIGGVYSGMLRVDAEKARTFGAKYVGGAAITSTFPPVFLAGAAVGIAEDAVEMAKAAAALIDDWSEVVDAAMEIVGVMFTPDGAPIAREMGVETGKEFAARMEELSSQNLAHFTFSLGRWVGPTAVYAALSVLGVPGLAVAASAQRIARVLAKHVKKLPKLALLMSRIGGARRAFTGIGGIVKKLEADVAARGDVHAPGAMAAPAAALKPPVPKGPEVDAPDAKIPAPSGNAPPAAKTAKAKSAKAKSAKAKRPKTAPVAGAARSVFRRVRQQLLQHGWKPTGRRRAVVPDAGKYPTVEIRPNGDVLGSYDDVRRYAVESGLTAGRRAGESTIEVHHLLEDRLMRQFGVARKSGRSVALEATDHQHFSTELPRYLPKKQFYDVDDVFDAHARMYREAGHPEWVDEMRAFLRENRDTIRRRYQDGSVPGGDHADFAGRLDRVSKFLDAL